MKTYQLLVSHIVHNFCNFEWMESIHLCISKSTKTPWNSSLFKLDCPCSIYWDNQDLAIKNFVSLA